ncbi:MAG: type II toxin-antitoxin system RelE/ParE family toxin [Elusimicrobia bacterium]|nr:type II toxin-antitoxin system RelE/ParE family toxin [Elusimicrobiota bacterium]
MLVIHFSARAARELRECPAELRERLLAAIESLEAAPRPPGCRKLSGALAGSYRIRVGHYRVIYDVYDGDRAILIAKIGPRKSIYR